MEEIVFVTHNKGKIASAQRALKNVNVKIFEYDLDEPRSDDVNFISKKKVMEAYELVKTPCISMDSGFWIDALNGFPKAFVNFSLDTIGIDGILKLMDGKENRACRFVECLSYYDGKELHQFMGRHEGSIAKEILGNDTNKKWSDLWYIYKPQGYNKTLAEMTDEERENRIRYDSVSSLDVFAEWFKNEKNRNN
jgi:XTP/dITP diphosphohydrolase